jgi:hypothetical protein
MRRATDLSARGRRARGTTSRSVRRVHQRGTWRTRCTGERHQRIDSSRERGADPFDASQVRQGAEWSALCTLGDDSSRHDRSNTGQRVELLGRRQIDVDSSAR